MSTLVTSKGQVTIPKAIRECLGIKPGNSVDFQLAADGSVTLVKVGGERPKSHFAQFRGIAGPGPSTDELMKLLRGD